MVKFRRSVIGRAEGRPVIGRRELCYHRRRPDIPIPYVLLLDIPIPDIPIPDIPKKKIGISIMFAVFLPNIPIPDISTRFRNNEHNFTKKCSLFL